MPFNTETEDIKNLEGFMNDLISGRIDLGSLTDDMKRDHLNKGRDNIYPYAPNGKETNLTEEQYHMVRTSEFKAWFGDWQNDPQNSSKVLDANGEPKVYYHGSNAKFDSFDLSKASLSSGQNTLGKGFYFTDCKEDALSYGSNLYEVFLNLRNPDYVSDATYYHLSNVDSEGYSEERRQELVEDGFDGVVCNFMDSSIAVALLPVQIKSAEDNNGNFRSDSNSFRESALLAPNGKKSNLTEEQWHTVRTPEFKAWFGDWEHDPENASKVIDENGEPLVVYHGTVADFDTFESSHVGRSGFPDTQVGEAYFFTTSKLTALSVATYGEHMGNEHLMPVFLNIRDLSWFDPTMWGDEDTLNTEGMANLIENGKNIGRDGILYKSKKMGDTYVVFKPNQIKSATDNNGNFDPKKNSIRESTLLAPNGKPSNLNEKQWQEVRTPEFKKWFGDWEHDPKNASQIVDENGEPKVMYHGTPFYNKFDAFNDSHLLWFTDKKDFAREFVGKLRTPTIMEVFLNVRNPRLYTRIEKEELEAIQKDFDEKLARFDAGEESLEDELIAMNDLLNLHDTPKTDPYEVFEHDYLGNCHGDEGYRKDCLQNHQDGAIIVDTMWDSGINHGEPNSQWVVFDSTQVKSATENNGNFDPQSKSIKESMELLAPNGKPSNLNDKQWHQVRTPEFKAWFGDWEHDPQNSSKVVDENGEPRVVYHGTYSNGFSFFEIGSGAYYGGGIYFTYSKHAASTYGNNILEVFLNIRNPNVVGSKEDYQWLERNKDKHDKFNADVDAYVLDAYGEPLDESLVNVDLLAQQRKLKRWNSDFYDRVEDINRIFMKDTGFDGISVPYNGIIMALVPEQIKSATDNNGNFKPNSKYFRESGYNYQKGMSNNAVDAYSSGEKPISKWTKNAILDELGVYNNGVVDTLSKLSTSVLQDEFLYRSSWHHTGKFFNETDFYALDTSKVESMTIEDAKQLVMDVKTSQKKDRLQRNVTERMNALRDSSMKGMTDGSIQTIIGYDPYTKETSEMEAQISLGSGRLGFHDVIDLDAYKDGLSEDLKDFVEHMGTFADASKSGNWYEEGRKPSHEDHDNPSYFKKGEHRIDSRDMLQVYDGGWNDVEAIDNVTMGKLSDLVYEKSITKTMYSLNKIPIYVLKEDFKEAKTYMDAYFEALKKVDSIRESLKAKH